MWPNGSPLLALGTHQWMALQTPEIFPKTFDTVILLYYCYSSHWEKVSSFCNQIAFANISNRTVMYYACILCNNLLLIQKPPGGVTHLQPHCLLLNVRFLRCCGINNLCLRNTWPFFEVPSLIGAPLQSPRVTPRSRPGGQVASDHKGTGYRRNRDLALSQWVDYLQAKQCKCWNLSSKPTSPLPPKNLPQPKSQQLCLDLWSFRPPHPGPTPPHPQGASSSESFLYIHLQNIGSLYQDASRLIRIYSQIHTGEQRNPTATVMEGFQAMRQMREDSPGEPKITARLTPRTSPNREQVNSTRLTQSLVPTNILSEK